LGEAAARNAALDLAIGDYFAFLDSDDMYLPNALADHVCFLSSHEEFDVSFSDGYVCDANGRQLTRLSEHRPNIFEGNILDPLVLNSAVITVPSSVVTRREIIAREALRFDASLGYGTDWDFWINLAHYATFGYLAMPTCIYRLHDANMTRTKGERRRNEDLVHGRKKVLRQPWFGDLSTATRRAFFEQLAVTLLSGQPDKQREIVASGPFLHLPALDKVALLRHMAGDSVVRHDNREFAGECVERALALAPQDPAARLMNRLVRSDPRVCRAALRSWATAVRAARSVRNLGKRQPKPVPSALAPVGE
jgi:glycosyltransferase involved in cell wall biosynthesis